MSARESSRRKQTPLGKQGRRPQLDEQRQTEDALRESEDHYRHSMELSPQVPWTADPQGNILDFSSRWLELTGHSREEALGQGWASAPHPDDFPRMARAWTHSVNSGEAYDIEHRVRTASGEYRWMQSRAYPRRDAAGHILRWYGTTENIEVRRQAEMAQHESDVRYRTLLERIQQGFCILEMIYTEAGEAYDYRFLEVNATFERHSGLLGAPGKTALELVPGLEQHWMDTFAEVVRTGQPFHFEQGSEAMGRWFEVDAVRVGGAESKKVALLFTDVTERKRNEAELRESERRYRALAETQKRFVNDAAHELRAPLTAIQGNLELLERYSVNEGDRKEMLSDIHREAARLGRMVSDLLTLARGDVSPGLRVSSLKLDRILESVFRDLERRSKQHHFSLETLTPVQLEGDGDRLRQLAFIVLENAVKYTPSGGNITLKLTTAAGLARFEVKDSGPGLSSEHLDLVFERFYRVDSARSRGEDPGGTGLGLSIARQIVEAHGGRVWLESELGEGTVAVVELPIETLEDGL